MDLMTVLKHSEWLQKNFNKNYVYQLVKTYEKAAGKIASSTPISPALSSLGLDLIYSLLSENRWNHLPIFRNVIISSIVSTYKLDQEKAEFLYDVIQDRVFELSPSTDQHPYLEERDFFLYIATHSLREKVENSQLGLLKTLYLRLKNAAESIQEESESSFVFLPEVDSKFSEILVEISEKSSKLPWILDRYQLKFLLLKAKPSTVTQRLYQVGTNLLFESLLLIDQEYSKQDSLASHLLKSMKLDDSEENRILLLESLTELDLVYVEAINGKKSTLRLGETALKITAAAGVNQLLSGDDITVERILNLAPIWQSKLYSLPETNLGSMLEEIFFCKNTLPPECLEALTQVMITRTHPERIIERLGAIASEGLTPWHRIHACKASVLLAEKKEILPLLKKAQESTQPSSVKSAIANIIFDLEVSKTSHSNIY